MTVAAHTFGLLGFVVPGGMEWVILLVLGLLIFGRRLPEVGRSLGKGIVEFKRGIKGIEDEVETESSKPGSKQLGGNPVTPGLEPPPDERVSRQGAQEIADRAAEATAGGESADAAPPAGEAERAPG
ncbi:MAG: twin-arginine translocase TatA/TatE family subunit [Planctomycetota bacterium]|jgi:sec-independent protein translocase protein TatA